MDIKELQNFIKFVTKSGASEVSLETDTYKVTVKTAGGEAVHYVASAPAAVAAAPAPAAAAPAAAKAAPVGGRIRQLRGDQIAHDWHLLLKAQPRQARLQERG